MSIQCVVVTPERTELETAADYVSLPMFDGDLGIQKGRAPMIGRLGYGVLRLQTTAGPERYYVDGGFAQVEDNVVNILTGRLIPVDSLDHDDAQSQLEKALEMPAKTPEESEIRATALAKARGQLRASR
ncbi:MAG: F0F1 ATP synthase subunit epsilon [Planctomycetota bacterium]